MEMEEICPFANCGRKFVSNQKLKKHMEMRHLDEKVVQKKAEERQQEAPSTPIPDKQKKMLKEMHGDRD